MSRWKHVRVTSEQHAAIKRMGRRLHAEGVTDSLRLILAEYAKMKGYDPFPTEIGVFTRKGDKRTR